MHYLYILISKQSGKYYIGETNNIEKRIQRHRTGKTSFGKRNKDLEIVYKKEFNNRSEARKLENFLKEQKSHKFIDKLIKEQLSLPPPECSASLKYYIGMPMLNMRKLLHSA